ncbi:MAG: hypothetical protein K0S98_2213, partial [Propionibacteriaceae bacterium]|nr:hypothetical protein [Propionibacteriaceae bacterium]
MADDQGTWLPLGDASKALGTSVDALRYRVRKGEITSRKGNDGRVQVLVGVDPAVSAPQPDTSVEIAMLREELAAASSRADRAEGELAGLREALTRVDAS